MTAGKYVRTAREDDGLVAEQRQMLDRLAEKLGVDGDVRTYVDNGASGMLDEQRPAMSRLVLDIASGELDTVLAVDVDRITRDPAAWVRFANYCHAHDVTIEFSHAHKLGADR